MRSPHWAPGPPRWSVGFGPGPLRGPRTAAVVGGPGRDGDVEWPRQRLVLSLPQSRAPLSRQPSSLMPWLRGSGSYFKNSEVAFPSRWGKGASASAHFPKLSRSAAAAPSCCLRLKCSFTTPLPCGLVLVFSFRVCVCVFPNLSNFLPPPKRRLESRPYSLPAV